MGLTWVLFHSIHKTFSGGIPEPLKWYHCFQNILIALSMMTKLLKRVISETVAVSISCLLKAAGSRKRYQRWDAIPSQWWCYFIFIRLSLRNLPLNEGNQWVSSSYSWCCHCWQSWCISLPSIIMYRAMMDSVSVPVHITINAVI